MIKNKKTITICSSASFYDRYEEIMENLKRLGFKTRIPFTASRMIKNRNFNVEYYKTWFNNPNDYKEKARLTRKHFTEVEKGDAILVLNYKKNSIAGYIGGAVLSEMTLAFYLKKPIFILNPIDNNSIFKEEILGMFPKILDGNLSLIKF